MNITIDDSFIEEKVKDQVDEVLNNFKLQFATVDIVQLSEITSLSRSTLLAKFTCEPEIVEVTRRVGTRVLYLYPEVLDAYKTVLERVSL
ncbi:hypothetical protein [Macrococcus brunensis]|uniref:hypothetical protein n=1 Tax=Macrococcus brunensis TaxID=198483 RepID=UPI001EF07E67|nr:hypothetical protein [Macrococcus brunensis]ULG73184.1 hypothetical protein MGG13_05520 [Macrococcus brunensis]